MIRFLRFASEKISLRAMKLTQELVASVRHEHFLVINQDLDLDDDRKTNAHSYGSRIRLLKSHLTLEHALK